MTHNSANSWYWGTYITHEINLEYPSWSLSCTIDCGYLSFRKHAKLVTNVLLTAWICNLGHLLFLPTFKIILPITPTEEISCIKFVWIFAFHFWILFSPQIVYNKSKKCKIVNNRLFIHHVISSRETNHFILFAFVLLWLYGNLRDLHNQICFIYSNDEEHCL